MRRIWRAMLAALLAAGLGVSAEARPFTIDDLLRQESFGTQTMDPQGRWLVIERRDPYLSGSHFDYGQRNSTALSRLLVVDLANPAPAKPLIANDSGPGDVVGAFSPSGTRVTIYRLRAHRWTLGVVTIASGEVRWLGLTPEQPSLGQTLQWVSDTELLVIARADDVPPWVLREGWVSAARLPDLWAASASGRGSHTALGSGTYSPVRVRPAPSHLMRVNVETGDRRAIAAGDLLDLEVSPDRRRVALLEAGADLQPRADGPAQGAFGIATQATALRVVDLKTGQQASPCAGCDVLQSLLSWSPSGRSLLIYARRGAEPWSAGELLRLNMDGGRSKPVGGSLAPRLDLRPEVVRAYWIGEHPIVLARPRLSPEARFDWYRQAASGPINLTKGLADIPTTLPLVDATGASAIAGGNLWRLHADGRAPRLVAEGVAAVHNSRPIEGRPQSEQRSFYVLMGEPGARRLARVDARGAHPFLDLPPGLGPVMATSSSPPSVVTLKVAADDVETLHLSQPRATPLTLAEVNARLSDVEPPRVLPVRHLGPDGRPLTSWLFLPPTHPGAPPPPLVIRVYSGDVYPTPPRAPASGNGFVVDVRMLVGHGYAVLTPSLPRPRAARDAVAGLAERILAVVDAAASDTATAGTFNPTRLALWGHSYGGYSVLATIGQTHRFRAAVAISGLSDLISKWAALPVARRVAPEDGVASSWSTGNTESGQNGMGAPPWTDPARYLRSSPLLTADRITTPLLLFHGDQDLIPLAQSEAMFSALYRQNKDAMLVTYWGEGHLINSPGNVRDLFARSFVFLDAQLATPTRAPAAATVESPAPGPASGAPTSRP